MTDKSIELIVTNGHTEVDEDEEYNTSYFSNDDNKNLILIDTKKYISIKGRKLLDMDSDIYLLNRENQNLRVAYESKCYFENAPEGTEVILLAWEGVYHRDLGAQSLIARFYGPIE